MRWHRDQVICETHSPGPWCEPGQLWKAMTGDDKRTYRITRIREVGPTALLAGGSAPCWEVRGRPA